MIARHTEDFQTIWRVGNFAKFWLEPVDLESSIGYKSNELADIGKLIQVNILLLKARWDAHFGS